MVTPLSPAARVNDSKLHQEAMDNGRIESGVSYQYDGRHLLAARLGFVPYVEAEALAIIGRESKGAGLQLAVPVLTSSDFTLRALAGARAGVTQQGDVWSLSGEVSGGLEARYQFESRFFLPSNVLYGSASATLRGHLPLDTAKVEQDRQITEEAASDFAEGAQKITDRYADDMNAIAGGVSDESMSLAGEIVGRHMQAFSSAVGPVLMQLALASITPGNSDNIRAQEALDSLVDTTRKAMMDELDKSLGKQGEALAAALDARTQTFLQTMQRYATKEAKDYKDALVNPVEPGYGVSGTLTLGYIGESTLWTAKNGERGGGFWLGVGAEAQLAKAFVAENDAPTFVGDPALDRFSVAGHLRARFQVPSTCFSLQAAAGPRVDFTSGPTQVTPVLNIDATCRL
jgi:hypothetical protein